MDKSLNLLLRALACPNISYARKVDHQANKQSWIGNMGPTAIAEIKWMI